MPFRDARVRVYPPHRDDPPKAPTIRQARIEAVPRLPNTTPPHLDAARADLRLDLSWAQGAVRANALRLDVLGAGSEQAIAFADLSVELLRFFSLQWWITRDDRFDEGYIRNTFSINALGERVGPIGGLLRKYGGFAVEKVLTREMFVTASYCAGREERAPLGILAMCDAIYFLAADDLRRFYVEAAVACEVLLGEHATNNARLLNASEADIRREIVKPSFEQRLSSGTEKIYGRSFAAESPEQYEWLIALWVARGNVAHGKPAVIRHGGETRAPTGDDRIAMMTAVVELAMWLQRFGAFRPTGPT